MANAQPAERALSKLATAIAQYIPVDAQPVLLVPVFIAVLYILMVVALRLANKPLAVLLGFVLSVVAVTVLFLEATGASILRSVRLAVPGAVYFVGDSVVPVANRSLEAVSAGSKWLSTTTFGVLGVPAFLAGWALHIWNTTSCSGATGNCVHPVQAWVHLIAERL